jgi:hypothetical protein
MSITFGIGLWLYAQFFMKEAHHAFGGAGEKSR